MKTRARCVLIGICLVTLVVTISARSLGEAGAHWKLRLAVTAGALVLLSGDYLWRRWIGNE